MMLLFFCVYCSRSSRIEVLPENYNGKSSNWDSPVGFLLVLIMPGFQIIIAFSANRNIDF